jgi:hypothetical protein
MPKDWRSDVAAEVRKQNRDFTLLYGARSVHVGASRDGRNAAYWRHLPHERSYPYKELQDAIRKTKRGA